MKIKVFLIFLSLTVFDKLYAQNIDSVKIEYTPFITESFDRVDCASFRHTFKNKIQNTILKDVSSLNKVICLKKHFIKKKQKNIDVRGILTLNIGSRKIQYCFDRYGYFDKDGVIFYNKKLLNYLDTKAHFW